MRMQAESLEVLEKADASPALARAIVRAIEIELGAQDILPTKQDVASLKQDVLAVKQDVLAVKQDVVAVKHDVEGLRRDMSELAITLRGEMAAMRGDLRAEIHASVSGVTRQMYVALVGQV